VSKKFTLGKHERLKSRKQIDELFAQGNNFYQPPLKVFYLCKKAEAEGAGVKMGVAVSSKNFKRAVNRNRIKRLVREAYRLQKPEFANEVTTSGKQLAVFFVYTSKELINFAAVHETMKLILQRLRKLIHENHSQAS